MAIPEILLAVLIIGLIGRYLYVKFQSPSTSTPITPEQLLALQQEKESLLKEDLIYNERLPYFFKIFMFMVFGSAFRAIPQDPVGTEGISDRRLGGIAIIVVAYAASYFWSAYEMKQRVRRAAKAALGSDAKPLLNDEKRRMRLEEIERQLKSAKATT